MEENSNDKSLDKLRKEQNAYEYLCRLEEAKIWLEYMLDKELPDSTELEEHLRNGIDLARLATIVSPETCHINKVYDPDFERFNKKGLHFKHTDNIVLFIKALKAAGLPSVFIPETVDLYDGKNLPRIVFCIHALSHYLAKLGKFKLIKNLYGEAKFDQQKLNKIQLALEKYKVTLPVFNKIGGMLAAEMPEDQAAIHAATLLVSDALDSSDKSLFMERLNNPILKLLRIFQENSDIYYDKMKSKKDKKSDAAETLQKTGEELDVYDKMLSLPEIQDCINQSNVHVLLQKINSALAVQDKQELAKCFSSEDFIDFSSVKRNGDSYASFAIKYSLKSQDSTPSLILDDVKSIIGAVNKEIEQAQIADKFISSVEQAIKNKDTTKLINLVISAPEEFRFIDSERPQLVFQTLEAAFKVKNKFDRESLASTLKMLAIVCEANRAIDLRDEGVLYKSLQKSVLSLNNLNPDFSNRYLESLYQKKSGRKTELRVDQYDLSYEEIVEGVESVNLKVSQETGKLDITAKINERLLDMSSDELLKYLRDERGMFKEVVPSSKETYLQSLTRLKMMHDEAGDSTLYHNEIQQTIIQCNSNVDHAVLHVNILKKLNNALIGNHDKDVIHTLKELRVSGLISDCQTTYVDSLKKALNLRSLDSWDGWTDCLVVNHGGLTFNYNFKTEQFLWFNAPPAYDSNKGYLNSKLVQEICDNVGSSYNRELYFKGNIDNIVLIQQFHHTMKVHKKFIHHLNFINKELPNLITMQSYFKTYQSRTKYLQSVKMCAANQENNILIKSYFRTYLKNQCFKSRMEYYENHLQSIMGLQSFIRGFITKSDYNNLVHVSRPSLKQLYRCLKMFEIDSNDVLEEKELVRLRNCVFSEIKHVREMDDQINQSSITISLLIKNRINIQDAQAQRNKQNKKVALVEGSVTSDKKKLEFRDALGQMFYVLKHEPMYVSRYCLLFTKRGEHNFLKEFFNNLFNYANTSLDEYLVLKTIETMLRIEITESISSVAEFMKENTAAIMMSVHVFRDTRASSFIKASMLDPLNQVLQFKGSLSTNPSEVYKQWINQKEVETGTTAGLPYEVSPEEALKHEEVINDLKKNMKALIDLTSALRDSIINSREFLPYGIRATAKMVHDILAENIKNPNQDDLMKAVANAIYYRFINPAIVSPDKYVFVDNVDVSMEQIKNLAAISSLLQSASAGKIPETFHPVMQVLHDFMRETQSKFRQYFESCIDIPTLEEHYNVNEFTDLTQLRTPEVKFTVESALSVHHKLLDYSDIVINELDDPFLKLVKDIPIDLKPSNIIDIPPYLVQSMASKKKLDKNSPDVSENVDDVLAKYIVTFQLTIPQFMLNKKEYKTKELINNAIQYFIDLLRFCHCDSVSQVLEYPFTTEDEKKYHEYLITRDSQTLPREENQAQVDSVVKKTDEIVDDSKYMTLSETKSVLHKILEMEELSDIVMPQDDYNGLLMLIFKNILQRTQYIRSRKMDIARYRTTLEDLQIKLKAQESQLEFYESYIKGINARMGQQNKKSKKRIVVKKSAAYLANQKIIMSIDQMPVSSYKAINVEFSTTDDPGVFLVKGSSFGVEMGENYRLVFPDLLKLQHNNINIVKINNGIQINVNLMINFLNKHFHTT